MALPNLPAFYDMIFTHKDGKLTPDAHLYNDQSFQVLNSAVGVMNSVVTSDVSNNNVTINGINPPPKTTAEITALQPAAKVGTIWFNTTLGKLQVKTAAGVVETITST